MAGNNIFDMNDLQMFISNQQHSHENVLQQTLTDLTEEYQEISDLECEMVVGGFKLSQSGKFAGIVGGIVGGVPGAVLGVMFFNK